MDSEHLRIVEVIWESRIWNGTRRMLSVHKDLGYVTYESATHIRIAPEFRFSSEGRRLRVRHEQEIDKRSHLRPTIFPLEESSERTNIVHVDYEDPFHMEGVLSSEEAISIRPSTLRLLGYLVQEDEKYVWIAAAIYEYRDGTVDYVTVHVIPKRGLYEQTFLRHRR